jgi:hypothetical protein
MPAMKDRLGLTHYANKPESLAPDEGYVQLYGSRSQACSLRRLRLTAGGHVLRQPLKMPDRGQCNARFRIATLEEGIYEAFSDGRLHYFLAEGGLAGRFVSKEDAESVLAKRPDPEFRT